MIFQHQSSVGPISIMLATLACLVMVGLGIALINRRLNGTHFAVGVLIAMCMSCGGLFLMAKDRSSSDASFSKQLMDEYHATSSRPLSAIKADVSRYHEANTVFTQDGRDTPVAIKMADGNDKKITMVFTGMNDQALYPKATSK